MSRIPYVEKQNAPQEVAELYARIEANGADVLNLWKMAAHSPATLAHVVRLGNAILSKTEVDPKLRELAILRVAEILGCAYEIKAHAMLGKGLGMTDEQLASIKSWERSSVFTETERAVLRFTDELTKNGKVSQSAFSGLEKHLSHRQMMEITVATGFYGMLARVLLAFEVDLETNSLTSPSQIVGRPR